MLTFWVDFWTIESYFYRRDLGWIKSQLVTWKINKYAQVRRLEWGDAAGTKRSDGQSCRFIKIFEGHMWQPKMLISVLWFFRSSVNMKKARKPLLVHFICHFLTFSCRIFRQLSVVKWLHGGIKKIKYSLDCQPMIHPGLTMLN